MENLLNSKGFGLTMSQWTRGSGFNLFTANNNTKQPVILTGYTWKAENKMDSGAMVSPTYQNFPRRRTPPPPPRTPSPDSRRPPALPPRNYLQQDETGGLGKQKDGGNIDEAKIDFKSLFHQWENNSPREDAYAAQLRKQALKFSGQRGGGGSAAPSSMSVIHSRTQMGISTSYKQQPNMVQEATSPATSPASSATTSVSSSVTSSVAAPLSSSVTSSASSMPSAGNSSPHLSSSDISQAGNSSQPIVPPETQEPVSSQVEKDNIITTRPAQMLDQTTLPSRENNRPAINLVRGEAYMARDRSASEIPNTTSEQLLPSPPNSRERSSSDTHVFAKVESGHTDTQSALPLPSPPVVDSHDGIMDSAELPPPPPELLNDSIVGADKEEQPEEDTFADDSYGAYKNRGSRQVGNYQRSASAAAAMRTDSQPPPATDAQAVFGDGRLGSQNWNSDSQLQANRRSDSQPRKVAGGIGAGVSASPGTSAEQHGNLPTFKADSGSVRNSVKKFAPPQPLNSHTQSQSQSPAGDGKTYTARPCHFGPHDHAKHERVRSPEHPRSVKERISNLERKNSFSSPTSSSNTTPITSPLHTANTTTSSGQRWANATSTQRSGGENVKPQAVISSKHVPNTHSAVLRDHQPKKERPLSGSFAPATQDPSTQGSVHARPRAHSEYGRPPGVSPSSVEPNINQRYNQVSPTSPNPNVPGPARHSSQYPSERPRSSSSPYNRRESAPAPQIPSEAILAMVSPRRKSEGSFLPSPEQLQKEASSSGHGRQPSQEELECDQQARQLAKEVALCEKKLSTVLNTDASQKRMQYMDGLFTGPRDFDVKTPVSVRRHHSKGQADASSSNRQVSQQSDKSPTAADEDKTNKRNSLPKEYFVSPPKAVLEMEWRKKEETSSDLTKNIHDNDALIKQKEELIQKLLKKLGLLKEERGSLQEEIEEIEQLGKRVCEAVNNKCENRNERDKFHTYISDHEKIVRLMLNLSGQLARAENAVQALAENADPEVKQRTLSKRERLQVKHAEAKQLKEDIDKRSEVISSFLRQSLSPEELNDYAYFVKMKSELTIELQELEDKITLGQEQIEELKKSIPERTVPACNESLSPSSSTAPSPVPSS